MKKIVEELNKCIAAYPDLLWDKGVELVVGNGKEIKENFWFRCPIKKNRLSKEFEQYTHLHFTPHSVSDVNLNELKFEPPIDKFPFFDVASGNIISCAESTESKANWKKHPNIKQLVLVSDRNEPYGPLYRGENRGEKKNLENFIEISNKGKKYYVPKTCYYPLLKEDAVNECRWENDPVYEAMKEMYEALQCCLQKKNGKSIF